MNPDVFVIGGGPAGLAAAIAARRAGLSVEVADGNRPPIDKACGEGLMPDALAAAARISINIPRDLGFSFRGICFRASDTSVQAGFPTGAGLGIRRTVLHSFLISEAEKAGAKLRWNTPIPDPSQVRARWIVGADGSQSLVRKWAGLDRFARNSRRYAFRRHFRIAPWTEFMEIYWGDGCQVYITPVSNEEICVAGISRDSSLRLASVLARFPQLAWRLKGLESSFERGAVSATSRLRRVTSGNVALIGDASGTVDAITGEGLCLAFQQAAALTRAFTEGKLDSYHRCHRKIGRRPEFMGDSMLLLDRFPRLRRLALSTLTAKPSLFGLLLAIHVGAHI